MTEAKKPATKKAEAGAKKTQKAGQKKPLGRPSKYTDDLGQKICELIVQGRSLQSIARMDDMPCLATLCNWLNGNQAFLDQYEKARVAQADTLADQIMDLADQEPERHPVTGAIDGAAVQLQKLRIDARKWVAAKLKPKKYGDRVETTVKGDADNPLHVLYGQIAGSGLQPNKLIGDDDE